MRVSLAIAVGFSVTLHALPANAQVGSTGISGGGATGGVGASGTTGVASGISDSGSATGGTSSAVTAPIMPDAGLGVDSGGDSAASRATEGSSSINSLNVDELARSGTGGSAVTSTIDDYDEFRPTAGSSTPQASRIPAPTVGVDLGAIRRGMAAGPSATPKPNGD